MAEGAPHPAWSPLRVTWVQLEAEYADMSEFPQGPQPEDLTDARDEQNE